MEKTACIDPLEEDFKVLPLPKPSRQDKLKPSAPTILVQCQPPFTTWQAPCSGHIYGCPPRDLLSSPLCLCFPRLPYLKFFSISNLESSHLSLKSTGKVIISPRRVLPHHCLPSRCPVTVLAICSPVSVLVISLTSLACLKDKDCVQEAVAAAYL